MEEEKLKRKKEANNSETQKTLQTNWKIKKKKIKPKTKLKKRTKKKIKLITRKK